MRTLQERVLDTRNPRTGYFNTIKLSGDTNNNRMERLNGEVETERKS